MSTIKLVNCKSDEEFEKLVIYLLDHRKEINAMVDTVPAFFFLAMQSYYGGNVLAMSDDGEVVGFAGYVFGTPEKDYTDQHIARIEMAYINKEYRSGLLFLKGLKHLVKDFIEENKALKVIQFYISKEKEYVQRVCSKFANIEKECQSSFGAEFLYTVEIDKLRKYLKL